MKQEAFLEPIKLVSTDPTHYYALAYANDLSLSRVIPSTIKLRFKNLSKRLKPFEMKVVVGSSTYYNIDFCTTDQCVVLYQGVAKQSANYNVQVEGSLIDLLGGIPNNSTNHPWGANLFSQFSENEVYSQYLKLTDKTYSPSVRVFTGDSDIYFPLTEYSPELADPNTNLYKCLIGRDGVTQVIFGDSVWGTSLQGLKKRVQVFFLDATYEQVAEDLITKIDFEGKTYRRDRWDFEIISLVPGRVCSTQDLKNQMLAHFSSAVLTKNQIEAFCNSFPDILDSQAVKVSSDQVNVYIKPVVEEDNNFALTEAALSIKGDITTVYNILHGIAVNLRFILSHYDLEDSEVTQVDSIIKKAWSYENTTFSSAFSLIELREKLYSITRKVIFAEIGVSINGKFPGENKLDFLPVPGTVKFYDEESTPDLQCLCWDSNGYLYTKSRVASAGGEYIDHRLHKAYGNEFFLKFKKTPTSPVEIKVFDIATITLSGESNSVWLKEENCSFLKDENLYLCTKVSNDLYTIIWITEERDGSAVNYRVHLNVLKTLSLSESYIEGCNFTAFFKQDYSSGAYLILKSIFEGQTLQGHVFCSTISSDNIISISNDVNNLCVCFYNGSVAKGVLSVYIDTTFLRTKALTNSYKNFAIQNLENLWGTDHISDEFPFYYTYNKLTSASRMPQEESAGPISINIDELLLSSVAFQTTSESGGVSSIVSSAKYLPKGYKVILKFDCTGVLCYSILDAFDEAPSEVTLPLLADNSLGKSVILGSKIMLYKTQQDQYHPKMFVPAGEYDYPEGFKNEKVAFQNNKLILLTGKETADHSNLSFKVFDFSTKNVGEVFTGSTSETVICGTVDYNNKLLSFNSLFPGAKNLRYSLTFAQLVKGKYFKLKEVLWRKLS